MTKKNRIKLAGANLLFAAMLLLPFLPGPPNDLVAALSALSNFTGLLGLFLVPLGIIWTILEINNQKKVNSENKKPVFYLAVTAVVIIIVFSPLILVLLFQTGGVTARIIGAVIIATGIYFIIRQLLKLKKSPVIQFNSMPLYLLTIPVTIFFTSVYIEEPVSDFSRDFAIQKSSVLITAIEDYKNTLGKYPDSIHDLEVRYFRKIPNPFVMGISEFRYNKVDDHYSISFSQWLDFGSLEEIVLYDKNSIHKVINKQTAFDYSNDLHRVNCAFASYEAGVENWRYYLCD